MPCFLLKSEEGMILPTRSLKNSTWQAFSDFELHCTGVITAIMND